MNAAGEPTVDGRDMEPPEPFVATLAMLDTLPAGASMRLLLHRQPFPLYTVLQQHGHAWMVAQQADGTYVIRITR